jgi:hypothetical protein
MSRMYQYTTQSLFIWTQPTWALTDTGGGYHIGAPNFRSYHSFSFPSSIPHFLLIALPSLQLNPSFNYSSSQHAFHEPVYKKVLNLTSGTCHLTSTRVLSAKYSTTNVLSTTIGSRWYTKGIMHFRILFHWYNINAQVNNNLRIIIK